VHIPFCHQRCTYCDFNIYAGMRALYEPYAQAVAQEARAAGQRATTGASTVYFGGGTPSMLSIAHIALMLDAIRRAFDLASDAEITLEANPRATDDGYFAGLRALGVNRISLGMQSAHAAELHLFRRGHAFDDVARTFALARAAGFENLNLDLIYGIPGQSIAGWRASLQAALALQPDHLSAYSLQVEERTTLHKWVRQGKIAAPDDDLAADMFELAEEMLADAGFIHYEISNWAGANPTSNVQYPQTASRHNLIYWRNETYIGLGCGAHSWRGGRRFWNVRHLREYVRALHAGHSVEEGAEQISRKLEMGETMMLGLRLLHEGVTFDRFASRFDADLREVYAREIDRLTKLGLIELDHERVRLSRPGRLVGNRVFGEFLS
jgi:oxygen-independent coproporphyrinogen-3 oxidase